MKARYLIAAAVAAMAMAACQRMEPETLVPETVPEASDSLFNISVLATKDVGTKALWLDGSELKAYWKSTEEVIAFRNGTYAGTLGVTPGSGEKPATATLTGTISVPGLTVGDEILLMLPRQTWDYTGQNGTLASLETAYDYATATVSAASISGSDVTTDGSADFVNEQSVYRFGFSTGSALSVKAFTITSANGSLVQSRAFAAGVWNSTTGSITVTPGSATSDPLYVSLRNESTAADTYSFVITGSDDALYLAAKAIPAGVLDAPGKFISANGVSVTKSSFAPVIETTDTAL